MTMVRLLTALAFVGAVMAASGAVAEPAGDPRMDGLIARMTLEEKAGQLNMVSALPPQDPGFAKIGRGIDDGSIGGLFNVYGAPSARELQTLATTRSRLGIPLLLAFDVVHGYRTIFPTPLGQAASWDMEAIRRAERIATAEAAADGVNLLLTPMLDVARDARWGRVVEGPGESAWLASRIAAARLRGVEGDGPAAKDAAASCAKHFGANGAVEGGRDYTALDLSERAIRETYLPPFRAAVAAGARCLLAAFNAPDGAPTIVNPRLLRDILRGEWAFRGVVISDFKAIAETVQHGVAADLADAARLAITAGADVDMQSEAFVSELPRLVRKGLVPEAAVDDAVRRVLALKAALGLFDDPFHRVRPEAGGGGPPTPANRAEAQSLAEKSAVLLKNDGDLLPFPAEIGSVALIGPLGDSAADTLGPWAGRGEPVETITLKKGLERRLGGRIAFTPGGSVDTSSDDEIAAAVETARQADIVVLALGERFNQSGEGASRASLALPGDQARLARAVLALGKPTIAVIMAGRPLVLTELASNARAILYAWQPGTMGGDALARLLTGDAAPTGRLPMTFPRALGQVPIYHDQRTTGRPAVDPPKPYTAGYGDESHKPLYPFGYGLAYTSFAFGAPRVDRATLRPEETATVSLEVTNTGKRAGAALAQLYVRPEIARIARPAKELRGYARVDLAPGETKTVSMKLTSEDVSYWISEREFGAAAGPVEIMTGPDAGETISTTIDYQP